jgi:glycosyltransferase involved in cell wall biosynthesis
VPSRTLIVTHEPLRRNLSGPGVRVLEIARVLGGRHAVTLATPFPPEIADPPCTLATYSFDKQASLRVLAEAADVIVVQGFTLSQFPFLAQLRIPIVADIYCPFTVEHLEMITSRAGVSQAFATLASGLTPDLDVAPIEADAAAVLEVQNTQLALADYFICANTRQRDFWIGALHSMGRINPRTYAEDPTLRALIDVVPFGVPAPLDRVSDPVMKGVRPGIGPADHVLLWAGAILDWQDPQTLVRAVACLSQRRRDIKLFFMGTRHPNPTVPPMRALAESWAIAQELDLVDRHVFFNDWVPYAERWRYLAEADLGLSTHRDHLETRMSFRTRMLDYLWGGLPIVCTAGDVCAELVSERGLGAVVPPGDVPALASAIERFVDDPDERERCRRRILDVAEEFRWSRVIDPLARFCDAPRLAPDRATAAQRQTYVRTAQSYRLTRWVKRRVVAFGVSQARIDQLKTTRPALAVLGWMNRVSTAWDHQSPD